MKTKLTNSRCAPATYLLAFSCIWAASNATAQIQSGSQTATNLSTSSQYACIQRGPNSKIWQRAELQTNASGIVRTNYHSYTELATGLSYMLNGQYVDSVEQINITGNGAEAVQGPCQVQWASDASTAGGAVQLTSPGGQQLTSRVYGLALMDASTGSNVLIAQITNSTGALVGQNQIVYPSAFSGLQADIQDIYRKSGFEQNVVLREQPPSPADYGLNPETTWIEVLTEFFSPPIPTKTTVQTDGESDDVKLDFGDLHIGRGTAFLTFGQTNLLPMKVNVSKQWETLDDGRVFLIEEVPYQAITNLLQTLPPHASIGKPGAKIRRTASLKSLLHAENTTRKSSGTIKVAQAISRRPGVVIDYTTVSGADTSYDFLGGATYYLSGGFEVDSPGPVSFEAGTVIKIPNSGSGIDNVSGAACNFNGYSNQPVIFTSSDDDSVGEQIASSSGNPSQGGGVYVDEDSGCFGDPVTVANARFSYAGTVYDDGSGNAGRIFQDCQFVNCGLVMYIGDANFVTLENILCVNCDSFIEVVGIPVNAVNITVDSCSDFASGVTGGSGITNSILTGCDSSITDFHLDHTTTGSSNGIYQPSGAGGYYLTNGSINWNAGTTNIDPALLSDLRTKTTHSPASFYGILTNSCTISNQAQLDTNSSTVDRGYHYDPLDCVIYNLQVSNATMTVLPGTTLAIAGWKYGINALNGASVLFQGTATQPINIIHYNSVQEGFNTNLFSTNSVNDLLVSNNPATLNFRFVNWSPFIDETNFNAAFSSPTNALSLFGCQFENESVDATGVNMLVTNCLFQGVALSLDDGAYTNSSAFYNNLFEGGSLTLDNDHGGTWTFDDNLFDQTAISQTNSVVADYNGYVTNNSRLSPTNTHDVVLSSSPAYQGGTLGVYYYPTNLTNLIHKGSRSGSDAGLYHYTVTTNNVIESNNTVSIGYHYVACGTNGLPLDSNGDGVPDYLEDYNGDGIVNNGETNWALAILTQPLSQIVCQGSNATFTVVANGVTSLTYQWQFNGTNNGATNSSLALTNLSSAQTGSYSVTVSNTFGSVTSTVATLTVVSVASLAPTNNTNCTLVSSNVATLQTWTIPVSTNAAVSNLEIIAVSSPYLLGTNLPAGWSLNGVFTNIMYVSITNPGNYAVICTAGTSAVTNIICITPNNDIALTTLHNFTGSRFSVDGEAPWADLVLSSNTLYGTTESGGNYGSGTVFKVNTDGSGYTRIHSFTGDSDGEDPEAGLVLSGSTLYGTTSWGSGNYGTVFKINTDGTAFTILHHFSGGNDGKSPAAALVLSGATLYGTTTQGGSSNDGTVFAIDTNGTGFIVLHSFSGSDGNQPFAGLVLSGATLYGTASYGGSSDVGTVFAVNTNGTSFATLYNFTNGGDGAFPDAGLVLSGATLYGTASEGGSSHHGTIFAVNTNGSNFTTLYSFTNGSDGKDPEADLMLSGDNLYGTTYGNYGTVFEVTTNGCCFATLHTFSGGDGEDPEAGLMLSGTTLYGTTSWGSGNDGTVFRLDVEEIGPPQIITQPASQSVSVNNGYSETISVTAIGLAPLIYQWYFDGTNIGGATNASLTLTNVNSTELGTYSVAVSNAFGSAFSSNAVLTNGPGTLLWKTTNTLGIDSSPALGLDGTIYVTAYGNILYAINPTNGNVKWNNSDGGSVGGNPSSPAIGPDGTIYFGTSSGFLFAVSNNGATLWSNFTGGAISTSPAIGIDGTLYVGKMNNPTNRNIAAVNADGTSAWSYMAGPMESSPVIGSDCTVYAVEGGSSLWHDDTLTAFSHDGDINWLFVQGVGYRQGAPDTSPAIGADGTIYCADIGPDLYALNPNGTLKWMFDILTIDGFVGDRFGDAFIESSPVVGSDGTVYFGADDYNVYAVTNGALKWVFTGAGAEIYSSPALGADGTVYFGSLDDNFYAVTNGVLEWVFTNAPNSIYFSPAIAADGTVYFTCDDRSLYALKGNTPLDTNAPWPMFGHDPQRTASEATVFCTGICPAPVLYGGEFGVYEDSSSNFAGNSFSFYVSGPPNSSWDLFISSNMVTWTDITNIVLDTNGNHSCLIADGNYSWYPTNAGAIGVTNNSQSAFFYLANPSLGNCCSRIFGFTQVTLQPGDFVADPFNQSSSNAFNPWADRTIAPMNTLGALFDNQDAPYLNASETGSGVQVEKWNGGGLDPYALEDWVWTNEFGDYANDATLLPGESAIFVTNSSGGSLSLVLAGLVAPAGLATNQIIAGTNYLSSILPQAGYIGSDLNFTNASLGDQISLWDSVSNNFDSYTCTNSALQEWTPSQPYLGIATGFILVTTNTTAWVQEIPSCLGQPTLSCAYQNATNCSSGSGPALSIASVTPGFLSPLGQNIQVKALPTAAAPGVLINVITNEGCIVTTNVFLPASAIITNWWQASGPGADSESGVGLTASFTPSTCGTGTLTFHLVYSNAPACVSGLGATSSVSLTNNFYVAAVDSLVPTNGVGCTLLTSNATCQAYSIIIATNTPSELPVLATSCPSLTSPFPSFWSLNGMQTNVAFINTSLPATYTVVYTIGISSITNVYYVIDSTNTALNVWITEPQNDSSIP